MSISKDIYHGELVQRLKQLDAQVDVLRVDIGVDEVDELRRLRDDVERLYVVRLLTKIVLKDKR